MTDAGKVETLVRYRLEQADEALSAAAITLAHDFHRSAVNRAYYAMFYAVLALLASRQLETSRPSGAISQFDQLFVKSGLLPREFSQWLHDGFSNRQAADYGAELVHIHSEVESLLAHAREFVAGVRRHLQPG